MRPRLVTIGLMGCLLCATCVVENSMVQSRPRESVTGNQSSILLLAGEFRAVFANLLWVKADQYHHEFSEHNPSWTKNKDLLGMLRLITTLDPHFVEAYSTGAVMYTRGLHDPLRASAYLEQGLANNPRSWDLHRMAVILYARHFNDPNRALPHARLALKYCDDQHYKPRLRKLLQTAARMVRERRRAPGVRQNAPVKR